MAVDSLQMKIRKTRSPVILELGAGPRELPLHLLSQEPTPGAAYGRFCRELLETLKELIPGVRFSFSAFALLGPEGMGALSAALALAAELGYYTLLDAPELMSPAAAKRAAQALFGEKSPYPCDALVLPCYLGTDLLRPFLPYCEGGNKDLFIQVRTGNKSASELQDLRIGTRLVHTVAADYAARFGGETRGRCGYTRVGFMASAVSAESLRTLRREYPDRFVLVEGYDYPWANAKNCAGAFDRMGYGAAICSGLNAAGQQGEEEDYLLAAKAAAERMTKNISRYVTIL